MRFHFTDSVSPYFDSQFPVVDKKCRLFRIILCKTIIHYVDCRLLFIILPVNHALVKINWCPASSIDLSWTNHIFYLSERCILDCSAMFSCKTALNSYVGLVWDI